MSTSTEVRADIIDALRIDLVGPRPGHPSHAPYAHEILPIAPSKWYLTGFLIPYDTPPKDRVDDDGSGDSVDPIDEVRPTLGDDDDVAPETTSARKGYFPASMGLTALVPAETNTLHIRFAWADYVPHNESEGDTPNPDVKHAQHERAGGGQWRRIPREASQTITLHEGPKHTTSLDAFPDIRVVVSVRTVHHQPMVPEGTRSVSIFILNARRLAPDATRDAAYLFQPELSVRSDLPFVARPDAHGAESEDWDTRVADLQYRDAMEYAVGHNVSAVAIFEKDADNQHNAATACRHVKTAWMPSADVEKVVPRKLNDVELGMDALAAAPSAPAVRDMVGPMTKAYAAWIASERASAPSEGERGKTASDLLDRAVRARARIDAGLRALDDPHVLDAFRRANHAIATAIRQRATHDRGGAPTQEIVPAWRPFQLAFVLMNIVGVANPEHEERDIVDLLFFPTGGGKTEAYLGIAAFTIFLRRLRDPSIQSSGVTVLMRYTLRLLTLDQLGRAATLICAMELMRQGDVESLGPWPIEIGLWVGRSATPNRMGAQGVRDEHSARTRVIAYKNDSQRKPSPIPLENCPWCGTPFGRESFHLSPDTKEPKDLRVSCVRRACAFWTRSQPKGLPILTVDEPIYRRLPAFLIATVDKFAGLPWEGQSPGLFGRVARHDRDGFYVAGSGTGLGQRLARPLPPPALIIQDELHLISGPLGTMVGLYETAVDALARADGVGQGAGPKIIASTATVRRAERQIRALFARSSVEIFPPPGPRRRDAFFAITVSPDERAARTYLGVAAQGRNQKVVYLRTMLALMAAAQKAWDDHGGKKNPNNPADPYMTVLGYFSALRELGGSRRIVDDEVKSRLKDYADRRRRINEPGAIFANRPKVYETHELTSRVSTKDVSETKQRLALSFNDDKRLDVALATNMISVGLDITRLGLMVVLGQPKSASEYIQATSRVGRDDEKPGLVITLLNIYRPRDRSHYERFAAWHESFYRAVEATSVTPFAPRAIDRGIAAITVALARHGFPAMTPPRGAEKVSELRADLDIVADVISKRAEAHDATLNRGELEELRRSVHVRVSALLDAWAVIVDRRGGLQYQREVGGVPPLLFVPLDPELARQTKDVRQFTAGRSLRDVEPVVNLWLRNPNDISLTPEDG